METQTQAPETQGKPENPINNNQETKQTLQKLLRRKAGYGQHQPIELHANHQMLDRRSVSTGDSFCGNFVRHRGTFKCLDYFTYISVVCLWCDRAIVYHPRRCYDCYLYIKENFKSDAKV